MENLNLIEDKIMNIKEVATYLKCSEAFIRKLTYSNSIPSFRIGRRILFRLSRINDWILDNE